MERHFPALARLGSRIRGDLAHADTPESADTEAGRTALLARLVRSSACAEDIGEEAALNQADDLRPRLHKLLQSFTDPELRALWSRLGSAPPATGETPAHRLYARRLTELQMAFVAGRLFRQDRAARDREALAAQQDTLRQLDGSEDRLATIDLLGLRLRTLYSLMDRAQVALEMVGWQELPETESIESAAIRAQVIFSMSTVLRGEPGARDHLLFAGSLSDLHGDRPSAWRLQSHMIHIACAHITADERSRLRGQCRGLALQARALLAQGDTERAKDCLRLQEVMLRALLIQGAEGPRAAATSADAARAATAQTRSRSKDPEGKHPEGKHQG